MKRVLVCFALLALGVALAGLVGLGFPADDQSTGETLIRQATVFATLAIGLAATDRTAAPGRDFVLCLLAWVLLVATNAVFVVAVLALTGPETPAWAAAIPEASFRSIGWFFTGPDASPIFTLVLWLLSGIVVIGLGTRGANLIRRHFFA